MSRGVSYLFKGCRNSQKTSEIAQRVQAMKVLTVQGWKTEFNSQNPCKGARRELRLQSCPLISTCMLCTHVCTHTHTFIMHAHVCLQTHHASIKTSIIMYFFKEIQLGELGLMTDAFAGT